ncbi:MAG: hypothetical protein LBC27_09370 [Spirochaetaceae bacterium]|nr:hypothetical protein [Spirochaetaceae bacterium]
MKGFVFSRLKTTLFFTAFLLVCFAALLYVLGNVRGFTDRTQFFLLNTILYVGLFTAFYTLLNLVFKAGFTIVKHKNHIHARSFVFLLFGMISFIFSVIAAAILVLSKGNMK